MVGEIQLKNKLISSQFFPLAEGRDQAFLCWLVIGRAKVAWMWLGVLKLRKYEGMQWQNIITKCNVFMCLIYIIKHTPGYLHSATRSLPAAPTHLK